MSVPNRMQKYKMYRLEVSDHILSSLGYDDILLPEPISVPMTSMRPLSHEQCEVRCNT